MNDTEKESRIKRLVYRANHRGIKEMDIVLGRFAKDELQDLEAHLIDQFEILLTENDRDLLTWITSEVPFPHDDLREVFEKIEKHALETPVNG